MIKTKEDLISKYVVRADKEVFELFMQKCEELDVKWTNNEKPRDYGIGKAIGCDADRKLSFASVHHYECANYKRLTLADFKPTKHAHNTNS